MAARMPATGNQRGDDHADRDDPDHPRGDDARAEGRPHQGGDRAACRRAEQSAGTDLRGHPGGGAGRLGRGRPARGRIPAPGRGTLTRLAGRPTPVPSRRKYGGVVRSPGIPERTLMSQDEPGRGSPIGPVDWHKLLPFEAAASDRLGWAGLEAASAPAMPAAELDRPPLTHHTLVLFTGPPEEWDRRYEGVKRCRPPPAGSVSVVPAGTPSRWRWRGTKGSLHVYLEPGLVGRVAAEAFGLDPARLAVPPLDGLDLPHLRAALTAVGAELASDGAGGPLASESLANLLTVHLIRHVLSPRLPERRRDGMLPRGRLRAVVEYIEEHLDGCPTLAQMAAVA